MQSASDETTRQLTPLVPLTPVVAAAAREDVPRLTNDVFGYLPYWEMNSKTERYLRYDLLTTIAFFGVPINPNGGLGRSSPGYKAYLSPRATRIIQRAHAGGVRTEITFRSFGTRRNAQLFGSGPHRRQFVKQAMALMRARGADGANLDIELISSRYYAAFGALVRWLKEAAVAQNPDAQISVATNANVSGARMAAIALANGADRVFMMGYDYKWSGSERVGAVDPLVSATHGLSLSRSVNIYNRYHVPLDKVILGLGYYGRSWPTASKRLHARVRMNAARYGSSQVFFPRSLSRAKKGATLTHDRYEQAARLLKFDKSRRTWVQTYFNDPAAISAKLQLTHERDLAGMGIWALGYDRGLPGFGMRSRTRTAPHPRSRLSRSQTQTWGSFGGGSKARGVSSRTEGRVRPALRPRPVVAGVLAVVLATGLAAVGLASSSPKLEPPTEVSQRLAGSSGSGSESASAVPTSSPSAGPSASASMPDSAGGLGRSAPAVGTAPTPSSAPALVASPAIVHRLTSRPTRFSLTLAGPRAFSPNGDGRSDALAVALALPADGRAVVLARSFDGADVATLLDQDEPAGVVELTWDGSGVPDAPYTIVAQFGGQQATVGVARWSTEPLLSAPGSIVVVFDPGHGGNQEGGGSGNLPDGRRISEKTVNLDIARRAGAMLSAAGLVVRYTRTSDATVSLTDRIRFANAVRGDVFVAVHNNFIPGGGGRTEAFYCGTGCRAPSVSFSLARQILAAHLERLSPFESPAWQPTPSPLSGWNPTDDWDLWGGEGVAAGPSRHFYVLGPYDHLFRPDALVMASALSESLAATLPTELEMLGDPAVRGALGAAYADGIARFLAGRAVGVRLTGEGSVGTTRVGRTKMLRIRVTNTGSTPIPAGSIVSVGDRSRLAAVDGSLQTGRRIGSRRLATPLAPGSSTVIATPVRPRVAGARTWVVDLIVGNVGLSARRIPTLRLGPSVRP